MEELAARYSLPLEFVEAVEGGAVNYDLSGKFGYDRKTRNRAFHDLEKNEIACLLSHKKALERFLSGADDYCIVLEDDAAIT
jgi:GR25 family glycosyltransferase involved in LPS biosynthesis